MCKREGERETKKRLGVQGEAPGTLMTAYSLSSAGLILYI